MRRTVLTEAEQQQAEAVFQEHRAFVESVARKHSPHPQDVPDIIQAVGIKICQSLNGFEGRAKLQSWLFRVTVNAARDHHRRESRKIRVVERLDMLDPQTEAVSMGDPAITTERQRAVLDAIQKLRPRQRRLALKELQEQFDKPHEKQKDRRAVLDTLRDILATDPRILATNGNGRH